MSSRDRPPVESAAVDPAGVGLGIEADRDSGAGAASTPQADGPRRRGDRRTGAGTERGFVAVEWIAAMVFLLIPVVLIGAGASRWPERQQVARASASEGARAAVLADTYPEAVAEANRVASQVATNYGVPADQFTVRVDATDWDWGEEVTVTVTMSMPALDVPGAGSWAPTDWTTSSTQRIEDYRGLGD
ncbi:MAG: hypothetical protein AAGA59_02340 [Actinomycetota bacterium]